MKIYTNFPYSCFGRKVGATLRIRQMLEGLKELGHDITLFSLKKPSGFVWDQHSLDLAKKVGIDICLIQKWDDIKKYSNCDAVFGTYFLSAAYFDHLSCPITIDSHDLLTCNFKIDKHFSHFLSKNGDIFAFDREIFDKPISCVEFPIDEEELEVYRKHHPIMIAKREQERLRKCNINSTLIPFIPSLPSQISDYSGGVCFLGSAHLNNLYANDLLGTTLLPKIRLDCPDFWVDAVGELDTICRHFPAINYHGYLEDNSLLRTARFGIFSSFFGTGTQLKLLTYMSYGLPTVLFEDRLEPPLEHGINCLASKTYDEFVEYCQVLWKDKQLCKVMGKNARESIESYYTKDMMMRDLNSVIEKCLLTP